MSADIQQVSAPLSEFDSYSELGEFWDSHSLADYWDQTEEVHIEFAPAPPEVKPTQFGSVQADDITDKMIKEVKGDLFRDLDAV